LDRDRAGRQRKADRHSSDATHFFAFRLAFLGFIGGALPVAMAARKAVSKSSGASVMGFSPRFF
jgi:hypothetical protein